MGSLTYEKVLGGGAGWTRVQLPDGRVVTVRGDRARRNNNPGNIEYHDWQIAFGAIEKDGRMAVFRTREDGIGAQAHLLFERLYKNSSLRDIIASYAPPREHNTKRYQDTVSAKTGILLDTRLGDLKPEQQVALVKAMHGVEGNTTPPSSMTIPEDNFGHWIRAIPTFL